MKWLIQPLKIEIDKIQSILRILDIAKIDYDIVYPYKGEVLTYDKKPYIFKENEQYFVMGSYPLTRNVYKLFPNSVFSLEDYSFEAWFKIFEKKNMLNENAQIVKASDIDWNSEELFVRPLNDTKDFNGGIYNKNTLKYEGMCVVASIQPIDKEFRFFVLGGKIITASQYKINGQLAASSIVDKGAEIFAQNMVEKFNFPGYVIDIADTKNGYKIVELNCLNAAGLYEIDLYKLVQAVRDFYMKGNAKKLMR